MEFFRSKAYNSASYLMIIICYYNGLCILKCIFTGLVGLAVSYALSITNLLSGVVTSFTETEKQMVSVERVSQYIHDVPSEKQTSTLNVCSL